MDKITYLTELAEGLARWVPERERQDILRYYAEYFEEAGSDREGEVIAELGDPWALSCRLAVEGGYVTQEGAERWVPPQKKRKVWPMVTALSVALVAIVAVSVAMFAARIGGFVGRVVAGRIPEENVAQVVEDYVEQGTSWGGVAYVEGDGVWVSQEEGSLDAFDQIDVEIGMGNVTVQCSDDYALYIEQRADLNYELAWEVSDGKLKVKDKGSEKDLPSLSAVEVYIYVPDGAVLEKVDISTGLGDVDIVAVEAQKVTAASGIGDVECIEVRGMEKLELNSGTGNVVLATSELYAGVDIELHSGTGQVEASLFCAERNCAYEAAAGMGSVIVNGEYRGSSVKASGGDRPYRLDAVSGMGDVNITFNWD